MILHGNWYMKAVDELFTCINSHLDSNQAQKTIPTSSLLVASPQANKKLSGVRRKTQSEKNSTSLHRSSSSITSLSLNKISVLTLE